MSGNQNQYSRDVTRGDLTSVREFVHGFAANQQKTKKDALAVLAYGLAGGLIGSTLRKPTRKSSR